MLTVHQHWDPLKVCAVGRSYPPEFYNRIGNPRVRDVMKRIAIETEEDYQKLISKLKEFDVEVIRTDVSEDDEVYVNKGVLNVPPPMCPRDYTAMVGDTFYMPGDNYGKNFDVNLVMSQIYENIFSNKGNHAGYTISKEIIDFIEPNNTYSPQEAFYALRKRMYRGEARPHHFTNINIKLEKRSIPALKLKKWMDFKPLIEKIIQSQTLTIGSNFKFPNNHRYYSFQTIKKWLEDHNVPIKYDTYVNSAMMTRVGKDLFFGSMNVVNDLNKEQFSRKWRELFPDYNVHALTVSGHSDGSFCPVVPGLIVSIKSMKRYAKTFPNWEVVYLENESWDKVGKFLKMKQNNHLRWWIKGEENNEDLIDYINTWLDDWVTYVEESVFDVNMLVIDQKNVIVNGFNKLVWEAFERYGITPHIVNFRHRYFWDGGLHCITSDISRVGEQNSYFQ